MYSHKQMTFANDVKKTVRNLNGKILHVKIHHIFLHPGWVVCLTYINIVVYTKSRKKSAVTMWWKKYISPTYSVLLPLLIALLEFLVLFFIKPNLYKKSSATHTEAPWSIYARKRRRFFHTRLPSFISNAADGVTQLP